VTLNCPIVYATLLYATLRYSTLRYSTLRYSTLLYTTLHYATIRYSTLLYATLRNSTLLYATLRYATLLYATLRYSTLLYATLRYATLRYSTLLYATLLRVVTLCKYLTDMLTPAVYSAMIVPIVRHGPGITTKQEILNTTFCVSQCQGMEKPLQIPTASVVNQAVKMGLLHLVGCKNFHPEHFEIFFTRELVNLDGFSFVVVLVVARKTDIYRPIRDGRIILPSRWMHTRAATWELPGCSGRFSNCMGAHVAALLHGSFSNCIQVLCSHLQWHDTKLHAHGGCCPVAVTGYQTACKRGFPAAVQWQVLKLLH
jgi:hypothetical protein